MLKYKTFAIAFSYPDEDFFRFFPELISEKENLILEHDRLFRSNEIWLYSAEYISDNEFQRVKNLSDINGFYRAFGLETDKDRPDSLVAELEFMHYLIFKVMRVQESHQKEIQDKLDICISAQEKFFSTHLRIAADKIGQNVLAKSQHDFYKEVAGNLSEFLSSEEKFFKK